jgi:hypothetical protein
VVYFVYKYQDNSGPAEAVNTQGGDLIGPITIKVVAPADNPCGNEVLAIGKTELVIPYEAVSTASIKLTELFEITSSVTACPITHIFTKTLMTDSLIYQLATYALSVNK